MNKRNLIILFSFILINIFVWVCIYHKESESKTNNLSEFGEMIGDAEDTANYSCSGVLGTLVGYNPHMQNTIYLPKIQGYNEKFKEKQDDINIKLWKLYMDHISEEFPYRGTGFDVHLRTNHYLSTVISYDIPANHGYSSEMSVTMNMQTGEPVYLNDLIEINEDLVKKIKTSGYIKTDYESEIQGTVNCIFSQEQLDKGDSIDVVLKRLDMCSEPYTADNYINKPTFYMEKNRLYFLNLFTQNPVDNYSKFYIELDDIEEFLKVEKW